MKTYSQLIQEAEGFQGKFTPSRDTKRQAIEVAKKTANRQPGIAGVRVEPKKSNRPQGVADKNKKEYAGKQNPGALALRPKPAAAGPTSRPRREKSAGAAMAAKNKKLSNAQKRVDKRKSGVIGSMKSAMGGDMFAGRKSDSRAMQVQNAKTRRKARGDFAKKAGSAVLSTAKRVGAPQQSSAAQSASGSISAGPTASKYQA